MITELPKTVHLEPEDETTVGNYFVSNYPPYSFWKTERAGEAMAALERYLPQILLLESISISPFVESAVTSAISKFTPTKMRQGLRATWRQRPRN